MLELLLLLPLWIRIGLTRSRALGTLSLWRRCKVGGWLLGKRRDIVVDLEGRLELWSGDVDWIGLRTHLSLHLTILGLLHGDLLLRLHLSSSGALELIPDDVLECGVIQRHQLAYIPGEPERQHMA